jgi:hypothetical protein
MATASKNTTRAGMASSSQGDPASNWLKGDKPGKADRRHSASSVCIERRSVRSTPPEQLVPS